MMWNCMFLLTQAPRLMELLPISIPHKKATPPVMAKSRIAPAKELTLPQLELTAVVIGARLASYPQSQLHLSKVCLWSDSQIVLWLRGTKELKPIVRNRVREIKELTLLTSWKYCPTSDNPTELLTRGIRFHQFESSKMWKQGPSWLPQELQWTAGPQWKELLPKLSTFSLQRPPPKQGYLSHTTHKNQVFINSLLCPTLVPFLSYSVPRLCPAICSQFVEDKQDNRSLKYTRIAQCTKWVNQELSVQLYSSTTCWCEFNVNESAAVALI